MSNSLEGKRILALIYGTELYGNERGNLEALRALKSEGAHVRLGISARKEGGGDVGAKARQMGIDTFELPFGSHFAYHWMRHDRVYRNRQLKRLWTNSKVLRSEIRSFHPDYLHVGSVLPFIFCFHAIIFSHVPLVYRIGDAPPSDSRFQMFWWRRLLRRSRRIVCISHFLKQKVELHTKEELNIRVIHNLAPVRTENLDTNKLEVLKQSKRPLQLVFVGQINPIKGIDLLIDAMLQLNDTRVGCWVVGGNSNNSEFQKSLEHRVEYSSSHTKIHFEGYQQDPRPYFQAADWNISPSICPEGLGNVVQEAANERTPSIVTNNGGLPELIEPGVSGLILTETSADAIAHSLKLLLDNPNWSEQMGSIAFQRLSREKNELAFTSQWKDIYTPSK